MNAIDHYRGALIGLATGDALGTTVEFRAPGSFKPMTDIVGGGTFRLEPGQWTDDTSMALCLAESLLAQQGFNPVDQMERYVRWYRGGHLSSTGTCFDIGGTTRTSLELFEQSHAPYCGSPDPFAAGNGSIMRLAPVPLFFARDAKVAIGRSADSSRTTHGSLVCMDACRYLGALIVGAVTGAGKSELVSERFSPLPGYWAQHPLAPEIDTIARGSFKLREPPSIRGSGYVVQSLEAALWAFHKSRDFREGALLAVNLGDDADTTGAVYGQLAGAFYGYEAIPQRWRTIVSKADAILTMADRLADHGTAAARVATDEPQRPTEEGM